MEPTGAARLALAYRTQFSTFSAGTRLNAARWSVSQTASIGHLRLAEFEAQYYAQAKVA